MENKELIQTEKQLASTHQTDEMATALYHQNLLTPFPVGDKMLTVWAKSIIELEPEITPEVIEWICNEMKVNRIEFDNRKGIQNIFIGFREWIKAHRGSLGEKKYKILNDKYKKGAVIKSDYNSSKLIDTSSLVPRNATNNNTKK